MEIVPNYPTPLPRSLIGCNFLINLPAVHGTLIMGLLDGSDVALHKTLEVEDDDKKTLTIPNTTYGPWVKTDQ
jgi:hypothetical protein